MAHLRPQLRLLLPAQSPPATPPVVSGMMSLATTPPEGGTLLSRIRCIWCILLQIHTFVGASFFKKKECALLRSPFAAFFFIFQHDSLTPHLSFELIPLPPSPLADRDFLDSSPGTPFSHQAYTYWVCLGLLAGLVFGGCPSFRWGATPLLLFFHRTPHLRRGSVTTWG